MDKPKPATRFDKLSRPRAVLILSVTFLAILAGLFTCRPREAAQRPIGSGLTDPEVLDRIVARVHAGEDYYAAAGVELRANEYRVRSVFNWRQPLYAWFLGLFPTPLVGRILLMALAVLTIAAFLRVSFRIGDPWLIILCFWLVPGACYACFLFWGPTTLEISAGLLIALSILSYAADYWLPGLLLALLALFIRELVAPYIVLCMIFAVLNKRWRELAAWIVGLVVYAVYFAFHVSRVWASIRPTDLPNDPGWIRFGGLHFILTTAAQHVLFLGTPLWVLAIYLPPAVLGLFAIPGELGKRARFTVILYLIFFAFVGKTFNGYWGFLYSPLLAFGFSWAPLAIVHLWHAIKGPTQRSEVPTPALPAQR